MYRDRIKVREFFYGYKISVFQDAKNAIDG